jgi:hypothetical protein
MSAFTFFFPNSTVILEEVNSSAELKQKIRDPFNFDFYIIKFEGVNKLSVQVVLPIIIMMFASFLARFCFIAAAVVLHCSLFFCTESHCVYPVDGNPLIARVALYIPSEFFNMIPIELKTLQLLAQWIIVIEAVFAITLASQY